MLKAPTRVDATDGRGGRVKRGKEVEMEVRAELGRGCVWRKRGWEFGVCVEVWEVNREMKGGMGEEERERCVFRARWWFLEFVRHKDGAGAEADVGAGATATPETQSQAQAQAQADPDFSSAITSPHRLSFTPSDPWLWARVCKDYNLIHINSLSAKLFGLRTSVAHGNHVLARVLHAEGKVLRKCEVEFRRPVFLPADLTIKMAGDKIGAFAGEKLAVLITDLEVAEKGEKTEDEARRGERR